MDKINIIWSPSSWDLWKTCPAKYRIKKVERWQRPDLKEDSNFAKLAIPGIAVDKMLQFWLHRKQFDDKGWLTQNFDMVWSMTENEIKPRWISDKEIDEVKAETITGLLTAVRMLEELVLDNYDLRIQPTFFEKITEDFSIAGSADLLMIEKITQKALLIDFKNAHRRQRITKDQLTIYQIGLNRKEPVNIVKAGYLFFNPRLEQWKWFKLGKDHENKIIDKLIDATTEVQNQTFEYAWNHYTCTRFCDVRFYCEMFQQLLGKHVEYNQSHKIYRLKQKDSL
jgi:hypothetical protein